MTSRPRGAASAGFTLIEVLVALAILALAFAAGFRVLSGGLGRLGDDRSEQQALLIAESTLAKVGHAIALRDGEVSGRMPDGFAWRIDMAPYGDGGAVRRTLLGYTVAVTIAWTDRHRARRQVRLRTVRLAAGGEGL